MRNPINVASETSRIRAVLVNSGAYSIPEAEEKLSTSRLSILISSAAARTIAGQAALLTSVVTAVRCFGQVNVLGELSVPLMVPLPIPAGNLLEAVTNLGGQITDDVRANRSITIGPVARDLEGWVVQAFWDGWIAGVGAIGEEIRLGDSSCSLAGVAAGALAIGQAFLAEQGNLRAGRTRQELSLWSPAVDASGQYDRGPTKFTLPISLWLIGLGNLGQAYLWSLATLPYAHPETVMLYLQDDDKVDTENWGTSVLVELGRYNDLKTYIAEEWALRRGFQARRIDRRLDKYQRRTDFEPAVALAGLDKMSARKLLGFPGFDYVIDTGLGNSAEDYQNIRMNVFSQGYKPNEHFENVEDKTEQRVKKLLKLPAYKDLANSQQDGGCGAAMLAEKSAAVPFVSAVVGALAVTQAIRIASGKMPYMCLAGSLSDTASIRATTGPDRNKEAKIAYLENES